jgi:hypothetical protein
MLMMVCSEASDDSASFVMAWCRRSCGLSPFNASLRAKQEANSKVVQMVMKHKAA